MSFAFTYGITCANRAAMFQRIRDFLCKRAGTFDHSTDGIGWTLVDAVYAVDEDNLTDGDYFVAKTSGENSDFNFFIKFTYTTSSYIKTRATTYWDPTTHTGGAESGETTDYSTFYTIDSDIPILSIGGDLNELTIAFKRYAAITSAYVMVFGRPKALSDRSSDILTATSTYSAGSNISITFNEDLPSDWVVGKKIFLWSDYGDGFNVTALKTVNAGTKTITVDLSAALPTATVRGSRHFGLCTSSSTSAAPAPYALISDTGVKRIATNARSLLLQTSVYDGVAPDSFDGYFWCSPVILYGATAMLGELSYLIGVASSTSTPAPGDTVTLNGAIYRVVSYSNGSLRFAHLETPA